MSASKPPSDHSRTPIYEGRVVKLGLEQARLPDGRQVQLEIVRHVGACAVLPVHDDGTVTLVHQHRHAAGGMIYEVPAGLLEPGEQPQDCARRELAEETRLAAGQLQALTTILTTPGFSDERIHLFLATRLTTTQGELDADEYLQPHRVALSEAMSMCQDGRITDAKTICALFLGQAAWASS